MNILRLGDCLEVMKGLHDGFVDTIITDPPYGLSFMGKKWDYDVPSVEIWKACLRVLKPGGTMLCFAGSRTQHRMACNVEDAGFILKDCIMWIYGSGFPKATDISKQLDKKKGTFVEGKETANSRSGVVGDDKNFNHSKKITEANPQSPEAILWNGWKSHGLKPAYEPILVAMKPNEGTYANNALMHGVSGLYIDGGRIAYTSENPPIPQIAQDKRNVNCSKTMFDGQSMQKSKTKAVIGGSSKGRYPANIILDEEAGRMLDEQSGVSKSTISGYNFELGNQDNPSRNVTNIKSGVHYDDKGGASRFFYCAKASKKERNAGCVGGNKHPTVKPLGIMEYLCTLTKTPTGGIVLDPFMGSGTTGVACKKLNRTFVGIEKDPKYFEEARQRINNA